MSPQQTDGRHDAQAGASGQQDRSRPAESQTAATPWLPSPELREFLESNPAATVLIDRDWIFTYANQRALDLLGVRSIVGENIWTRFPGNSEEPFRSHYLRTMAERVATDFEAFNSAPLNRWYRVEARPFGAGIAVFFSDVTAQREAELARDRTSTRLQQVLDTTSDAVLSLDRDYVVNFVNRRAESLFAASGPLLGRSLLEALPDNDAGSSQWFELYRVAMEDRVSGTLEHFYPEPLNRWYHVEAVPSEGGIILFFRDITLDRAATEFLREQHHVLAFVQSAARVATLQIDLSTGVLEWGHGSVDLLGRPNATVVSIDHFTRVLYPDSARLLDEALVRCLGGPEVVIEDLQVLTLDGRSRWVEFRGVRESRDRLVVRSVLLDISARKEDEQALVASEARYRVLSELNPQALWTGSRDGEVTYANQRFLDYLGREIFEKEMWLQCFDPMDRERVSHAWAHSIATGSEYAVDARIPRGSDGASRWWHVRALPVRDESGAPVQWIGVAYDIDDQRVAAAALERKQLETEQQRAELESIYQNTPVGLGLFDPVDFRYLRLNDELARIIGLPASEIIGRTIQEVTGIDAVPAYFTRVVNGENIRNGLLRDVHFRHRPGETLSFNVNYRPVYDGEGNVVAIATASLDVTQQQRTEAALIQSEKLAAVGRLASSISHEINNPLEAVTNLLYLIAADPNVPEATHSFVRSAQSELARVSQIATQTLRFHRQAVRPTCVTPAQLIDAVLNLYQGRLNNSGIRVRAVYATATPILCFENDIRQVLNNLIANSIDAMRSGGLLLARAHDAVDPRTGRPGIRLSIADTGHGMDEATRQRVFEPFFTTKDLNGTGLGLWISTGIIERHHGHLTVRSSQHPVHHGTVFSLFLPHPVIDEPPAPTPQISDAQAPS